METIRGYTEDDLELEVLVEWTKFRDSKEAPFQFANVYFIEGILRGPDGEEWVFETPKQLRRAGIDWESYI